MIIAWLIEAVRFLLKLIIPPPPKFVIPKINPNAPCPACGNESGKISVVKLPNNEMKILHNCLVCKAAWHESPVLTARNIIHLAPVSTDNKKSA